MKTRTEVDSLGSVSVPADALYGAQTARAIENYPSSGFRAHPVLIRSYALRRMTEPGIDQAKQNIRKK